MMKLGVSILSGLAVVTLMCGLLPAQAQAQFSQQAKLVGTGVIGSIAGQGGAASLSADGDTVIVGAPFDNDFAGAAWVFVRAHGVWTQQAKLVGTGALGQAEQGISVSLSADGNTAVVGGSEDNNRLGAAWIFTRSGGVWSQQAKLVATDAVGSIVEQGFSSSISADGNTVIVGGFNDNNEVGAAWVYTRSRGVWNEQAKLVGTGAVGSIVQQGISVALSGDGNTAIVGGHGDNGGIGAAWVYTRSREVWTQQAKLVGTGAIGNAFQGQSVSLSTHGNSAIVGGSSDNNGAGASWVFTRSGGVWNQQAKLVGTEAIGNAGQGNSVSLSGNGNTAIVGGPSDNPQVAPSGDQIGAAWIFTRSGEVWSQQEKLVGTGVMGFASQGNSVSLSANGSTAAIGGPLDDNVMGATWVFAQPLFAGKPGKANCHGQSVSALAKQYGGLNAAAAALGYSSVSALQDAIMAYCEE